MNRFHLEYLNRLENFVSSLFFLSVQIKKREKLIISQHQANEGNISLWHELALAE